MWGKQRHPLRTEGLWRVSLRRWHWRRHISACTPRHLPPVQTLLTASGSELQMLTHHLPRGPFWLQVYGWREVPVCLALKPALPSLSLPQICLWPHYWLRDQRSWCGRSQERSVPDRGSSECKGPGASKIFLEWRTRRRSGTASPRWPRSQPGKSPPQHCPPCPAHFLLGLPTGGTRLKARAKSANARRDEPVTGPGGAAGRHVPHVQGWLLLDSARLLCKPSPVLLTPLFLNEVRNRDMK